VTQGRRSSWDKVAYAAVLQAPPMTYRELAMMEVREVLRRLVAGRERKRSAKNAVSRLTHHVYPIIGSIPIDRLTLNMCEEVMRRLPEQHAVKTRRNVGQLITRLLKLAVYPCRYLDRSPIPPGFLPNSSTRKAHAFLYPDEDRRLMACAAVPFEFRILYGFLTREGTRSHEATALTWSDPSALAKSDPGCAHRK